MNSMEKWETRPNNRRIGTYYEEIAKTYLEAKDYQILEMNYRTKQGEIDIIARNHEYTVFVEIKYRRHTGCGYPRESVHYRKRQTLLKVATTYLVKHQLYDTPVRFDVIEILENELTHLENAFMKG